jgi:hypothetical protein
VEALAKEKGKHQKVKNQLNQVVEELRIVSVLSILINEF